MSVVDYEHALNAHTLAGARRGFSYFAKSRRISSLLDVGAGLGTWLMAASEAGVTDLLGVDGVTAPQHELKVRPDLILQVDLRRPLRLERKFDAVLCLEVAEHLPEEHAATLIDSLCFHGDLVFFSAASPGQRGQYHVNCRAPDYWQGYFNSCGFVCSDELRERMWHDELVEPWYRQNAFVARRDPAAGNEPRLRYLIHPAMTEHTDFLNSPSAKDLENFQIGMYSPRHYTRLLGRSLLRRLPGHGDDSGERHLEE